MRTQIAFIIREIINQKKKTQNFIIKLVIILHAQIYDLRLKFKIKYKTKNYCTALKFKVTCIHTYDIVKPNINVFLWFRHT